MEVNFEGICLWERESRAPGLLGIIPDASQGEIIGGVSIPAHTACIIVQTDAVDASEWSRTPIPIPQLGPQFSMYLLRGDVISFDPEPTGGSPKIANLPKADCGVNSILRASLLSAPTAGGPVAAYIDLPKTADLIVVTNTHLAMSTSLFVEDGTTLVCTRNGSAERLRLRGSNPHVIVANVDLPVAFAAPGTTEPDDHHGLLYCSLFDRPPAGTGAPLPFGSLGRVSGNLLFPAAEGEVESPAEPARAEEDPKPARRHLSLSGLGSGCSNSTYP